METESLEGMLNNGAGRLESAAGEVLDDPALKVKGEVRQFRGKVEAAAEAALEKVGAAAVRARGTAAKAADQASETYDAVRARALTTADATDIFVKTRPYAAVGIAALVGFLIGAHVLRGGPKVIYIKPTRS